MPGREFFAKTRAFAAGGGGNSVVVAITREQGREGYTFNHSAGFFTTGSIGGSDAPVVRPWPPFLLVENGPPFVEAPNQRHAMELVRWEATAGSSPRVSSAHRRAA